MRRRVATSSHRVKVEAGNFFESVPAGDAYLLSHIIHDWSQAQCLTILANCRHAMNPGSRLLIIEMVLPSGDAPHPGKMLDILMLPIPGGQESDRAGVPYSARPGWLSACAGGADRIGREHPRSVPDLTRR